MLIHSAAPAAFWAEPIVTATYLVNRLLCRATGTTTPFELLFGVPPDYSDPRVFGCLCYPNLTATTLHKLAPRSTACVFIGYPSDHRGYRCFDIETRWVYTSRHVIFDEQTFQFQRASTPAPPVAPAHDVDDTPP
jgi:histone deacetylase 1/2